MTASRSCVPWAGQVARTMGLLMALGLLPGETADVEVLLVHADTQKALQYEVEASPLQRGWTRLCGWPLRGFAVDDTPLDFPEITVPWGKVIPDILSLLERPAAEPQDFAEPDAKPAVQEPGRISVDLTEFGRGAFSENTEANPSRPASGPFIPARIRSPLSRVQLNPGGHVLLPGPHRFTVTAEGTITSQSPSLRVRGNRVEVLCHRVELRLWRKSGSEIADRDIRLLAGPKPVLGPERISTLDAYLPPGNYSVAWDSPDAGAVACEFQLGADTLTPGRTNRDAEAIAIRIRHGFQLHVILPDAIRVDSPTPSAKPVALIRRQGRDGRPEPYDEARIEIPTASIRSGEPIEITFQTPGPAGGVALFTRRVFPDPVADWTRLKAVRDETRQDRTAISGRRSFLLPEGPTGVHLLRVALGPGDPGADAGIYGESPVAVHHGEAGSLTLMTCLRRAFLEGEEFEIQGVLRLAAEGQPGDKRPIRVRLVGPSIQAELRREEFDAGAGREQFFLWRIDTTGLAEGDYQLEGEADLGPDRKLAGYPLKFFVKQRVRDSDMPFLDGVGSYAGEMPKAAWDDPRPWTPTEPTVAMAFEVAGGRVPVDAGEAIRKCAEPFSFLPPPEFFRGALVPAQASDYLLRHGVSYLVLPFPRDLMQNLYHTLPRDEEQHGLFVTQHTAACRPYANFVGPFYKAGDQAMPITTVGTGDDYSIGRRLRALTEQLNRKHQTITDPVDRELAFYTDWNNVWANSFRSWQSVIHRMDTRLIDSIKWNYAWEFGTQARGGCFNPIALRPLRVRMGVENTDISLAPLHVLFEIDNYGFGLSPHEKVVWVGGIPRTEDNYPADFSYGQRQFLSMLGRGAGGVGFALPPTGVDSQTESLIVMREMVRRYGNLFLSLRRDDRVAILRSFAQSARGPSGYAVRCYQAYYTLMRARFPAGFVTEEEIDAGALERIEALILVSQTVPLPPRTADAVRSFVRKGGLLLADETTTLEFDGLRKVPGVSFDGRIRQKLTDWGAKDHWTYQMNGSTEYKVYFDEVQPFLAPLRQALAPRISNRLIDTPSPHLMTLPLHGGAWSYVTVVNDTFPDTSAPMYQVQTLPVRTRLDLLAKDRVVYDLLAMKEADVQDTGGKRTIDGDFRRLPGRILVLATERIDSARLALPREIARGATCPVDVRVLDQRGEPVKGVVPVELRITAPDGRERFRLYRAAVEGRYRGSFPMAGNELAGEWTVKTRELITGFAAHGRLRVQGDLVRPGFTELPEALAYDGKEIHGFLKSAAEKTVLLDVGQKALIPRIERLCAELHRRGVRIRHELLDPHQIRFYVHHWIPTEADDAQEAALRRNDLIGRPTVGDDPLIRRPGYEFKPYSNWVPGFIIYRPLILVGSPATNRFLREIQDRGLLYRTMDRAFPGPGRGLVQYCWTPFTWGNDAAIVMASDDAGLEKALDKLVGLADQPQGFEPDQQPRLLPYPFARFEPSAATDLPAVFAADRREPENLVEAHFGEAISGIKTTGDRLLVSFNSYGRNLAMLDSGGRDIWNRKVTEYDVLDIFLSRDGKQVAVKGTGRPAGMAQLIDMETAGFLPGSRYFVLLDEAGRLRQRIPLEQDGAVDFTRQSVTTAWDTRVACFGFDGALRWHYDDWPNARTLEQHWHRRQPRTLWLSPDGQALFAGLWGIYVGPGRRTTEESPAILLIDPDTGRPRATTGDCMVERCTVSPNGSCLAIVEPVRFDVLLKGQQEGAVRPIRVLSAAGKTLNEVPLNPLPQLLQVSDDARYLVTSQQALVTIRDLKTGETKSIEFRRNIHDIRILPACDALAACDQSGLLRSFDRSGAILWEKTISGAGRLAFSGDGSRLYVGTHTGRIYAFHGSGEVAWERDLTDGVFLDRPEDVATELRNLPSTTFAFQPPREASLLDHLPPAISVAEHIIPKEDFETGVPEWVQPAGAAEIAHEDAGEGKSCLKVTAPLRLPFRIPAKQIPDAHVAEFLARSPQGTRFRVGLIDRAGKDVFQQEYESQGAWAWERFVFKNLPAACGLVVTPPVGQPLFLDNWRFVRLQVKGENVAYMLSPDELAKQVTAVKGKEKESDVTTAQIWVFNEKCWSGGGRRSRGDMSPFPGNLVPRTLANGSIYDTDAPLYEGKTWSRKYDWTAAGNWGSFEFTIPRERVVHTLAVFDNPRPGFATRTGILQAWKGEKEGWITLGSFRGNRHAFHLHALTPAKARQFRYVMLEPGTKDNLFRTTEVEVYAEAQDEAEDDLDAGDGTLP